MEANIKPIIEAKNENKDTPDIYSKISNEMEENDLNEEKYLNENEISRNTIKNVYGNEYDQIMRSFHNMEEKTKNYFDSVIKQLEQKYEDFNSNIHKHFLEVTNKFTEAFKLDEENINEKK